VRLVSQSSALLLDKKKMEWIQSLPKIELHAHLNGSIRDSTLLELARVLGEKGVIVFADVEHVIQKNDRSLVEVFKLFDLIHKLTTDHKTVTRITREVVEDFALENVVYLELRTTPKVHTFWHIFCKWLSYMNDGDCLFVEE
jgi:adenosine deaminase